MVSIFNYSQLLVDNFTDLNFDIYGKQKTLFETP